jgi:hypothetical protein
VSSLSRWDRVLENLKAFIEGTPIVSFDEWLRSKKNA